MRAFYHLRMRPLEAKRIGAVLIASLFIAFIPISIPNAQADGCHDYPASVTPECVAQNLEEARLQTIAREEAARVEALAVIARAEAQRLADAQVNAARDSSYGATVQGCRNYPKSTTPECAAQNLEVERLASIDNAAKAKQEEANVNARAEAQRLADAQEADARDVLYGATIKGCRDFPKSTTPECAAQNLEVERLASIDSAAKAKQKEADVAVKADAQRIADALLAAQDSSTAKTDSSNLSATESDSETEVVIAKVLRIKKVVTCMKGSKTRTVTAWTPACPEGYKKKGLTKNA